MRTATGVILAGGKAKRMGRDKALVEFRGVRMLDQVAAALQATGLAVLVAGRHDPESRIEGVRDVEGRGGGPAVGLLTAFRHLEDSDIFLVAVDQPLLQPDTIRHLLMQPGDAVIPMGGEHPQVTCALYRRACHAPLEKMLAAGQPKLRRLLDTVDANLITAAEWAAWGEDGRSWLSLDTPEAVRQAEALP